MLTTPNEHRDSGRAKIPGKGAKSSRTVRNPHGTGPKATSPKAQDKHSWQGPKASPDQFRPLDNLPLRSVRDLLLKDLRIEARVKPGEVQLPS